jgi:hypothetical protein
VLENVYYLLAFWHDAGDCESEDIKPSRRQLITSKDIYNEILVKLIEVKEDFFGLRTSAS